MSERKCYSLVGTGLVLVNSTLEEAGQKSEEYACNITPIDLIASKMFINCVMDKRTVESMTQFLDKGKENAIEKEL